MHNPINITRADIYKNLATHHPARTLEEQKEQKALMDRARLIRDIESRPLCSPGAGWPRR